MRKALRIAGKATLVLLLVLVVAVAAIAGPVVWHYAYEIGLPDHHRVANAASERICSSDGNRIFVPLAEIPPIVRNAILAAEDRHFYARPPINPFAEFAKAALFDHRPRESRISTALVRCLINPQCCRSIDRHVVTAIVTYRLERDFPKDAILEAYLNEISLGRDSRGVAAAADAYFGKRLGDLSLDEIAFIAALPRAPSSIANNVERGIERRNFVLDRMLATGAISSAEAEAAKQSQLRLRELRVPL